MRNDTQPMGLIQEHSHAQRQAARMMAAFPHSAEELVVIERYLLWSALTLTPEDQQHPLLVAARAIAQERGWPA